MSFKFQVKENGKLLHAVARGALSIDDVRNHFDELEKTTVLDQGYTALVDLRGVEDLMLSLDAIKSVVSRQTASGASGILRPSRVALLVNSQPLYVAARQYEDHAHRAGMRTQVFLNEREALIWLTY